MSTSYHLKQGELINVDAYTRLTDYTILTYFNVYGDQT